jgi:pSer/pThr/pTyr-binding forkhead associated (FHA) protein
MMPAPAASVAPPRRRAERVTLVHRGVDGRQRRIPLAGPFVRLGREQRCEIVLTDPRASREHARIDRTASGDYVVTDLGGQGGVRVNGERVPNSRLRDGDRIAIQGDEIVFRRRG